MGLGDKIENTKDDLTGKGKEAAGKATDDERLEAEGKAEQAESRPQEGRRERQGRLQALTARPVGEPRRAAPLGGGPFVVATSCRRRSRRPRRRRSPRRR